MSRYRGVYRGPLFVPAFFRLRGTRQRCVLCIPAHVWKLRVLENPVALWTQDELDEAKREAKRFDAVVGWTKEGDDGENLLRMPGGREAE